MRASWFRRARRDGRTGSDDALSIANRPIIVTERQADPVELLYLAFGRLDAGQRQRFRLRIGIT
jgi:hypothetical protein